MLVKTAVFCGIHENHVISVHAALSTSSLVGGASYMPGEGLFNLPNIAMTTDGDLDESEVRVHGEEMEEEMRDLPPAKLVRLMAGESIVPSSQVKRNEGGRGRERIRKRKTGTCTLLNFTLFFYIQCLYSVHVCR